MALVSIDGFVNVAILLESLVSSVRSTQKWRQGHNVFFCSELTLTMGGSSLSVSSVCCILDSV